ncbi:hypothetical protein [Hymenobacter sp. APR13]|uniref:hypothetical protein n=1 Tax=Hymenobacter sp. APR13 TaxID=1356852 RepID=UPI0004E0A68E|nr:hypothetical protein [Hymenobacter sp. APR13]AII54290.1 hypothetical protein N008_20175 [Hymenobacter sp. APR13]
MHDLQQPVTRGQLTDTLARSTPGEELVLCNQIPDGNGGQVLPANPLFGEVVTGPLTVAPAPVAIVVKPEPDAAPMAAREAETLN